MSKNCSWTTSSIKRQYRLMHGSKHKNRSSDSDDNDDDSQRDDNERSSSKASSTDDEEECDSSDTDEVIRTVCGPDDGKKKQSDAELLEDKQTHRKKKRRKSSLMDEGEEDMINKIINGKMDDIEMLPYKRFNTSWDTSRHEYPLDVLTSGSHVLATTDISNRVNIWSLDSSTRRISSSAANGDLVKSIKLNDEIASTSIWSVCIDSSDRRHRKS